MQGLAAVALNAGLPLVERILSRRLGDAGGQLVSAVLGALAERLGAAPTDVGRLADEEPGRVIAAMREVERAAPELLAAYDRDLQLQLAALAADQDEPLWLRAWRPGGMYLIGFLWLWNAALLHVANAIWKVALPPMPFDVLLGLSGLYFSLYMGGHTVKDLVSKWTGAPK